MRYRTVSEAVRELEADGLKASVRSLTRGMDDGTYPYLMIGNRRLLDLDVITPILRDDRRNGEGVGIVEICEMTGLTRSAVYRGIADGWLPSWRVGGWYRFDPAEVMNGINARIQGGRSEG